MFLKRPKKNQHKKWSERSISFKPYMISY